MSINLVEYIIYLRPDVVTQVLLIYLVSVADNQSHSLIFRPQVRTVPATNEVRQTNTDGGELLDKGGEKNFHCYTAAEGYVMIP